MSQEPAISGRVQLIMKPRQQQLWAILFSTASFVAMLLAASLRAAEVPQVYVIFLSLVLSAGLGLLVALEFSLDRLARPKR